MSKDIQASHASENSAATAFLNSGIFPAAFARRQHGVTSSTGDGFQTDVFEKRDIETGDRKEEITNTPHSHAKNVDDALKSLYLPIYGLSVLTFVAGTLMVFLPLPVHSLFSLLRYITGALLFVCGCMLMMNNDLIVTTIRMQVQIWIMSRENDRLQSSVQEEAKEVSKLQALSSGLEKLQKQFADNVQLALKEVERYRAATQTTVRLTSSQLCKWYADQNSDGVISRGTEQDEAESLVSDFFFKTVPDYDERLIAWRKALQKNAVYLALDGIPTEKFALLISALFAKNWDNGLMQSAVDRILSPASMDDGQIQKYKSLKEASSLRKGFSSSFSGAVDINDPSVPDFKMTDYSNPQQLQIFFRAWLGSMVLISVIAALPAFGLALI
jgi:hypothetical protein